MSTETEPTCAYDTGTAGGGPAACGKPAKYLWHDRDSGEDRPVCAPHARMAERKFRGVIGLLPTLAIPAPKAGPPTPGQRWDALKDYLRQQIEQDAAVMRDFYRAGDEKTAAAHGALTSANRSTLAKMRALEAGL